MSASIKRTLAAIIVVLLASASWVVLGADEATFDLEKDEKTFNKLVKEMAWNMETPYPYGNWYGPGWWGGDNQKESPGNRAPVDELDAIAMRHDFAYQIAEEQGKIHGAAEEQRLKALADAIAVRDAKTLPQDPRDWDPPAADPAKADRYRRRIGFGFAYLSGGRDAASYAGWLYNALSDKITGDDTTTGSGLTEEDIDRMAREKAQNWFATTQIVETYRIELTAPQSVIAEGETVPLTLKLLPVSSTATADGANALALFAEASLDADGPGNLSASLVGMTSTVNVTAKSPWLFTNSYVGDVINITASSQVVHFEPSDDEEGGGLTNQDIADGQNYVRSVQILDGSIDLKVAAITTLQLSVLPESITSWESMQADPCTEVSLSATLSTKTDPRVSGVPVTFTMPDGSQGQATTNEMGMAIYNAAVCNSLLEGKQMADVVCTATSAETTTEDGNVYFSATDSATIHLEVEGIRTIRGRVVDQMHSNRPIAGAAVSVTLMGEPQTTTTGDDGKFSVGFQLQEDAGVTSDATISVTAKGFEPASTTSPEGAGEVTVRMEPVAAVITCIVLDAESGERLDGAIVKMTQPFATTVEATNGQATIHGFYVGDTVSISAGGFNHKTYQKTGVVTAPDVTITFNLPVGEGEMAGGDLDPTEVDPEDLPILHSLTIWATPANPEAGQHVTVTGQIFPPEPGIPIKLEIVGTDGYSNSVMSMTNAMGQAYLPIPGGGEGVVDRVTVLIIGENVRKRLNYSF